MEQWSDGRFRESLSNTTALHYSSTPFFGAVGECYRILVGAD